MQVGGLEGDEIRGYVVWRRVRKRADGCPGRKEGK